MKKYLLLVPALLLAGCSNSSDPSSFYRQHELSIKDLSFQHFVEHLKDDTKPYGEKIILSFVKEGCAQCEHQIEFIKDYLEQNKQVSFKAVFVDAVEDDEPIFKQLFKGKANFLIVLKTPMIKVTSIRKTAKKSISTHMITL